MTTDWVLACPVCGGPLSSSDSLERCGSCAVDFACRDGVWDFLLPQRRAAIDAFLADYTLVRHAEGRGSHDPAYYRGLPATPDDDPLAWQWRIRAATWQHVRRRVLPPLGSELAVVDVGAGVGWLSHRFRELGHRVVAVDVSIDDLDGLGAARHYDPDWPRLRAEFDHLPLAAGQADLIVYNASFHYSVDYRATLLEARRVLRPGGHVLVLDTPVYRRDESGAAMVAARHADFAARFGTRSDSMPSREYLTEALIDDLGRDVGVEWQRSVAWYGWQWWWRPYRARLRRKREPSRFVTLLGRVNERRRRPPGQTIVPSP